MNVFGTGASGKSQLLRRFLDADEPVATVVMADGLLHVAMARKLLCNGAEAGPPKTADLEITCIPCLADPDIVVARQITAVIDVDCATSASIVQAPRVATTRSANVVADDAREVGTAGIAPAATTEHVATTPVATAPAAATLPVTPPSMCRRARPRPRASPPRLRSRRPPRRRTRAPTRQRTSRTERARVRASTSTSRRPIHAPRSPRSLVGRTPERVAVVAQVDDDE